MDETEVGSGIDEVPKTIPGAGKSVIEFLESRDGDAPRITLRDEDSAAVSNPLNAESDLPKAARDEILVHAQAGSAAARAMIEADPTAADGYLLLALHLGFEGVAKGKIASFLEGEAP